MTNIEQLIEESSEILNDSGIVNDGQVWRFQRTYAVTLKPTRHSATRRIKLLVEINHDASYSYQSHYRISKWDGNQWHVVVYREPESQEMKDLTSGYTRKLDLIGNDADHVAYDLLVDALRIIV